MNCLSKYFRLLYRYFLITNISKYFSPLAQSPVKMRVEAFENAAAAATDQAKRPLRIKKENVTPTVSKDKYILFKYKYLYFPLCI